MYGNETNLEKMNPIQNRIPHECPNCGEEWRPQESTDGTKAELQRRIKFLERQLLETATAKPQCTQEAFAAHVKGRVEEEVEKVIVISLKFPHVAARIKLLNLPSSQVMINKCMNFIKMIPGIMIC